MLKPLGDRVVVEPLKQEDVTESGIVLPDNAKEKPMKGTVLAVGNGRLEKGQRIPPEVSVGDVVEPFHMTFMSVLRNLSISAPVNTCPLRHMSSTNDRSMLA